MSAQTPAIDPSLPKRTVLYDLHVANSARIVPFAGYQMPVQYAAGVLKEHLHTRNSAGFFDVSHMGQLVVRAKSGEVSDVARALETLIPVDILGLAPGRQRYGFFTNDAGGILDDLMIQHRGDHVLLVVNAACKDADEAHLRAHISDVCDIERLDRALIALQGPHAEAVLADLAPACRSMRFMDVADLTILGVSCIASRSGYTGEDGFEISVPLPDAERIAKALLANPQVQPIGLGARDSLRLEAGMCLYGSDLDAQTSPIEAGLSWAIQPVRRRGGERAGGFPGDVRILDQLHAHPDRLRVGLRPDGRAPVRSGARVYVDADAADPIGTITSGGFGPSVEAPIAMGYLPRASASPGTTVYAEVRGQRLAMTVTRLPFITPRYKR